jgi:hypothetical protein
LLLLIKKDDKTRVCADYRILNAVRVENRYPIPRIEQELNELQKVKLYSTLDSRNKVFHEPPISEYNHRYLNVLYEIEQARQQIEAILNENNRTFNNIRRQLPEYKIGQHVPIKQTAITGNDGYEVKKIGQHDGPKMTTCAEFIKLWEACISKWPSVGIRQHE